MSRRRDSGQPLPPSLLGPPDVDSPEDSTRAMVDGIEVHAASARTGEDTRRRGWFWHWNATVTQFAPLIGLKGVGLLNSYTVWTDRREESPHRGYAFPSQQSEADFYGEDRAELITINKILVALDLIEIRKEMVLRVDEAGRRWRVPHNLYRVKDRDDGFLLTADAVDRIVQLADRDRSVYRYIRHIFSPRFKPIDANNVWTNILETLRDSATWQKLAERAAHEDSKASARTRAGHRSRKSGATDLQVVDQQSDANSANDSVAVGNQKSVQTIVASTNKGSGVDVVPTNNGLAIESASAVAPANDAGASAVAPANTTYHQSETTTTTENATNEKRTAALKKPEPSPEAQGKSFGPGGREAPADGAGQEAALRAFHDANQREATIAERKLLRDLAERFDPSARDCGVPGMTSGWQWVSAAIYDAVDAGSTYVAPRRAREIMARWERETLPGQEMTAESKHRSGKKPVATGVSIGPDRGIMLPNGRSSGGTWDLAVRLMNGSLDQEKLIELFEGSAIAGFRDDVITVETRDSAQAQKLMGEYHQLLVRKVGEAMRRSVGVVVRGPDRAERLDTIFDSQVGMARDAGEIPIPAFVFPENGLTNAQLWQSLLEDVQAEGQAGRANVEAWLRPSVILARRSDGTLVIGSPSALACRRVQERFVPAIEGALQRLFGVAMPVEVVVIQDWLRQQRSEIGFASSPLFDESAEVSA